MEDIKIEMKKDLKKYLNNQNDAPPSETKKPDNNSSECISAIEILNIDDEFIEFKFKYNNEHNIKMSIKECLDKMKEYKDKILLNKSRCDIHKKEEYLSYCFECNMHLCEKCLMEGEHSYHYKINLM